MTLYKYFIADPAGNITAFVYGNFEPEDRARLAQHLMEDLDRSIEQVGFISPYGDSYRMDMMGGEFCGNASRSFGLYLGKKMDLKGRQSLMVHVSGASDPVEVIVDVDESRAEIGLGPAKAIETISIGDQTYPVIILEGIIHTILGGVKEDPDLVGMVLKEVQAKYQEEAYGVLFFDEEKSFMVPYVYVGPTASLIRESSCGSGTLAMGYYLNHEDNPDFSQVIYQPGGQIEVKADKAKKDLTYKIGGPVSFGKVEEFTFDL